MKPAAQGDASLAGAVYGVYNGDTLVDTYTTDQAASFTTKYYNCGGSYSIREITPSVGYLLDSTVYTVGTQPGDFTLELNSLTAGVKEQVIKGDIAIIKHYDDGETQIETPEPGAEFEVFLKSAGSYDAAEEHERDLLVTDEDGYAQSKKLPYGIYTVKQTKNGVDGVQMMPPFDVSVTREGKTYRFIINNAVFESLIKIVKKDAETGEIIPAAGTGFQVRDTSTGEWIIQHINYPTPIDIDTFYTDEDGMLMLPEPLPSGDYEVVEVEAPEGYVLSPDPIPFTVDGSEATITVEMFNTAQKGTVSIGKTGEKLTSVNEVESEYGTVFSPVFDEDALEGAVFDIIAAEDIITPDGTIRAEKGEVVDTLTSDPDGLATSKPLYLGDYYAIETDVPFGYVRDATEYAFTLTYAGQDVELTETSVEILNRWQQIRIQIAKNFVEPDVALATTPDYMDVVFGLYAAEDILSPDGKTLIASGSLMQLIQMDAEGNFDQAFYLPYIKYTVRELSTSPAYILPDEVFEVEPEYDPDGEETIIRLNGGEPVDNQPLLGRVEITKTDAVGGQPLPGAEIEIINENGDVVYKAVTGEDGKIYCELPYGRYKFRETIAPDGYYINEAWGEFEITGNGVLIVAGIKDEPIVGTLEPSFPGERPDANDGASPNTGDTLPWQNIMVFGIALMLVLALTARHLKKKKDAAHRIVFSVHGDGISRMLTTRVEDGEDSADD